MLKELIIKNIALIEHVHLVFNDSFTVITGETGAGKSIIIGALSLLSGKKASTQAVRKGKDKATIEAIFDLKTNHPIWILLDEMGIDHDEEGMLLVKREISIKGRSRCFVNNQPLTLAALGNILDGLVVIQGQHQQQRLLDTDFHLTMLDSFAKMEKERESVADLFKEFSTSRTELRNLLRAERDRIQRQDLLKFQLHEIEVAQLQLGEDEELAREEKIYSSAHHFLELLQSSYLLLFDDDNAALNQLALIGQSLEKASQIDDSLCATTEQFNSAYFQLQEIADIIRDRRDSVDLDPLRLDAVVSRLEEIKKLKKKYGNTIHDILDYQSRISLEYDETFEFDKKVELLHKKLVSTGKALISALKQLSVGRKKASITLKERMESELRELGMKHVTFDVAMKSTIPETLSADSEITFTALGADSIEFLISPNIGEPPRPVAQIASGGEISRIMLAFRGIIANLDATNTLIFDEIDVGIGGHIARTVGRKIQQISQSCQVICITHLPQIASMSSIHFLVNKIVENDRTVTTIDLLDETERVEEIARMLDGEVDSELSRDHAAELLIYEHKD